jgi:hypothetical protein
MDFVPSSLANPSTLVGSTLSGVTIVSSTITGSTLVAVTLTGSTFIGGAISGATISSGNTISPYAVSAKQFIHVHRNSVAQSISDATWEKVLYTTEVFDADGVFDLGNDRITPTIAGKYLCIASAGWAALNSGDQVRTSIYKNGASVSEAIAESAGSNLAVVATELVDMNGTTDYLEHWVYQDGTGAKDLYGAIDRTYFQVSWYSK